MRILSNPHWSVSAFLMFSISALVNPILRSVTQRSWSGWGHRLLTSLTTVALCGSVETGTWVRRITCRVSNTTLDGRASWNAKLSVDVIVVYDAIVAGAAEILLRRSVVGHVILMMIETWCSISTSFRNVGHS